MHMINDGRRGGRLLAPLGVFIVLTACGEPAQDTAQQTALASGGGVTLTAAQELRVMNAAMPHANLLTAGQPTQQQFERLVDMGYTNFISLRLPTENGAGWEEAHAMDEGVSFTRIPVAGANGLTRENVMALDRALDDADSANTVLYCASSNRVGGLLALKAYWLDGAEPAEALKIGRAAGLRSLEGAVTQLLSAPR